MTAKNTTDTLFIGLLLVIFGGIVLHAPLTVGFGVLFPEIDVLVKAWKELLMVPAVLLGLRIIWRQRRFDILKSPWMVLPAIYVLLHVLLIPLFFSNWTAVLAGLLIDLRFVVFFMLVFAMIRLYPDLRRLFLKVFLGGALLVGVFAAAQVTVLPRDALTVIGYGPNTIQPFLTVDENPDFVRISSTLRGPNPLGAYAVVVLALVAAYWLRVRRKAERTAVILSAVAAVGGLVALWFSYSRSALVAAVVALGLVLLLTVGRKLHKWVWIGLFVMMFSVGGALYAARDTDFVSNVILHENKGTGGTVSSNEGHIDSLIDGTERMVAQPLGAGIGSTGSASLFTDSPLIIENQYLFIAHEVGWLGLGLFLVLFGKILWLCWQRRRDWLALAVLASGIGLALIGLLLPVWVDDTVSIIWWGLAAIVAGGAYTKTHDRPIYKTTKSLT